MRSGYDKRIGHHMQRQFPRNEHLFPTSANAIQLPAGKLNAELVPMVCVKTKVLTRFMSAQYVQYMVNYAVLGKTGKASVTQLVSGCELYVNHCRTQ